MLGDVVLGSRGVGSFLWTRVSLFLRDDWLTTGNIARPGRCKNISALGGWIRVWILRGILCVTDGATRRSRRLRAILDASAFFERLWAERIYDNVLPMRLEYWTFVW